MPSTSALARDAMIKKKSTAPKKPAPSPVSYKSTEFVQDSDKEEEEDSESKPRNSSDSDDDSLPFEPADIMITPNGKIPYPTGSSSSSENESEDEEHTSEEEEGGSEQDEEEEELIVAPKKTAIEPVKKPAREPTTNAIAPKESSPYKPPTGFEARSFTSTPKIAQMFLKSNLEGKQIWYFTAPASVSISSIAQISLKDVKKGNAILEHQGDNYGFVRDLAADKTYARIMVPSSSEDGYRTTSRHIDQMLHLQQIVDLPGTQDSSGNIASSSKATVPAMKTVRPQPTGLKMRFRPIGFGSGSTGHIGSSSASVDESSSESSSDEEMEDALVSFQRPASIASESSENSKSSEDSESDDESSISHVEMAEAPAVEISPVVNGTNDKTPAKISRPRELSYGSLKRKHGKGEENKIKHRSSNSSSIDDDRELKRLKKSQNRSQRRLEDRPSASTNSQKTSSQPLPVKVETPMSKRSRPYSHLK